MPKSSPALAVSIVVLVTGCLDRHWASDGEPEPCLGPRGERSCVHPGQADSRPLLGSRPGTGPLAPGSGAAGRGSGVSAPEDPGGADDSWTDNPSVSGAAGAGAAGSATAGSGSVAKPPPVTNERSVLVGQVVNARGLAGIELAGGATVAEGALFRGPPLAGLTEEGCAALEQLGIRSIADLRQEEERASKPTSPCALAQTRQVLAPLPIPYSVSPQDYIADLYTTESVAEVFRALGDEAAYPLYFHCTWGRDRTGVLGAVILLTLGADRDAIMDDYLLSQPAVGAFPESLEAVLDEIEALGGIDAYLKVAKVEPESVEMLRRKAIATVP